MKTYIIGVWDKFTKWFIGFYEIKAESREQAEKIFDTNICIIKITEKKSLKEQDNNVT